MPLIFRYEYILMHLPFELFCDLKFDLVDHVTSRQRTHKFNHPFLIIVNRGSAIISYLFTCQEGHMTIY